MLLQLARPAEALAAYESMLARAPNRFNSLHGAGRAAELAGDRKKAAVYFRKLLDVAAGADTERPSLQHARQFLN